MFGLKIVNKQEYLNLKNQLTDVQALLAEKNGVIRSLENEIKRLNDKITSLNAPKKATNKRKKIELLTDVAESPLKVEEKPKTRKRVVKKSE